MGTEGPLRSAVRSMGGDGALRLRDGLWGVDAERSDGVLRLRDGLWGAGAEPCEPALVCSPHVLRAGLDPCSGPSGCFSAGGNARDWLRRRRLSPSFEGVERSWRMAPRTTPDELDYLLKLPRPELSHDLVDAAADAPFLEQQNGRYHRLGDTLSGGPSH